MNQTFNLNRFSNLFIKHTVDNYKTYLMAFFVLLGVLFLTMGFAAYVSGGQISTGAQIPFFIFVLLIAGSIFTSIVFSDLGNKRKAISILTLPASHFEKYAIGWVYSYLIFQLLFIPAFYLTVMLINYVGGLGGQVGNTPLLDLFSTRDHVYWVFYLYGILHAMCLFGSIYFLKLHFIKTSFTVFLAAIVVFFANKEFMNLLIKGRVINAVPFAQVNVRDETGIYFRAQIPNNNYEYFFITCLILVVILWACSFYRLKEKEV